MPNPRNRPALLRGAFLLVFALAAAYPQISDSLETANASKLEIIVENAATGEPLPARVYLFRSGNPFRLSPVDLHLPLKTDLFYRERLWKRNDQLRTLEVTSRDASHFLLLDGKGEFDLPRWEDYRLEAYRGTFFEPAIEEFSLEANTKKTIRLKLRPIAPGRQESWLAADDHIHLMRAREDDPAFLKWLGAEDLAVGNFLELQRQQNAAVQYAYGKAGEARGPGYSIRSGHESRSRFYGHTLFLGPSEMVPPLSIGMEYANTPEAYPFPTLLFAKGRQLGGLTGFAHFYGSQPNSTLLLNLARNSIDFVELFQFGQLRTEPWYELLNAGLRVVGLAGSDFPVPLNRGGDWPRVIPLLGPERALVKAAPGDSAYEAWAAGVAKGAVMLTNGPLLEFQVNEKTSGEVIHWNSPEIRLKGRATATWHRPIENLEIVINGEVAAAQAGNGTNELTLDFDLARAESLWIAARAGAETREGEPDIRAHANPVWFHKNGAPVHIESARKAVAERWERETAYFRSPELTFTEESQRADLLRYVEEAREILAGPPKAWESRTARQ